ncbi:MAG: hypothetical protein CME62_15595 [Halobacteriovoraceae bacterium]|nr:hypothetical protein [Halobacteriovoraceae bacterium]|tara:strand:- start:1961 stop:2692 length:732 start_codon:yes stop_codon:yes gene_type:complete
MRTLWNQSLVLIVLSLGLMSLSASAQTRRGGLGHQNLENDIQDKLLRIERQIVTATRAEKIAIDAKLQEAIMILRNPRRGGRRGGVDLPLPPTRRRGFRLAAVVQACGKIQNSYFAAQCIEKAKSYQVDAEVVNACTSIKNSSYATDCVSNAGQFNIFNENIVYGCAKITNTYFANECVKSAGKLGANARQVNACTDINNASYANDCVKYAGDGKVPARAIKACVQSNSNTYYAAQCVKSLKM